MAKKRTCICCGSEYEYCPNCNNLTLYPKWMMEFDKAECKELFNTLSGYGMGIFKKDDVKAVLNKYGVEDYSKYNEEISKQLNEIFAVKPKAEKTEKIFGKNNNKDIDLDK